MISDGKSALLDDLPDPVGHLAHHLSLYFEYREITSMSTNNKIVGAVMAILGLLVALVGLPGIRRPEKKRV